MVRRVELFLSVIKHVHFNLKVGKDKWFKEILAKLWSIISFKTLRKKMNRKKRKKRKNSLKKKKKRKIHQLDM